MRIILKVTATNTKKSFCGKTVVLHSEEERIKMKECCQCLVYVYLVNYVYDSFIIRFDESVQNILAMSSNEY